MTSGPPFKRGKQHPHVAVQISLTQDKLVTSVFHRGLVNFFFLFFFWVAVPIFALYCHLLLLVETVSS